MTVSLFVCVTLSLSHGAMGWCVIVAFPGFYTHLFYVKYPSRHSTLKHRRINVGATS